MKTQFILLLITIGLLPGRLTAGYGDPDDAYPTLPSWQERSIVVLTNACRTDPTGYRDTYVGSYNILLPQNYSAVNPLYWHLDLNRAARVHALDMANNCGMRHNSCDGTRWDLRVKSYYTESSYIAENIASGNASPQKTMNQWILDLDTTRTIPAPDKQPSNDEFPSGDGHRRNIMNSRYKVLGTGYAYNASRRWYHFWVQDFGGGASSYSHPVFAGSHLFISNKTTFMANYYQAAGAPQSASVYIDGQKQTMSLHLGTTSRGTYTYSANEGSACRRYYFSFTDAGGTEWLYPEEGMLVTYGEGSCATHYLPPESLSIHITAAGPINSGPALMITVRNNRIHLSAGPDQGLSGVFLYDCKGDLICSRSFTVNDGAEQYLDLPVSCRSGLYILKCLNNDRSGQVYKVLIRP